LQYYRRFGSWDLVAIAWFAGPGRAQTAMGRGIGAVATLRDGNGFSVGDYVPAIRRYMREAGGNDLASAPSPPPPAAEPQVYSPSWVQTAGAAPTPEPDAQRQEMRANLTDVLDALSLGLAGGNRILPAVHKPEIVGAREEPDLGDAS
jgi:hypothetical protein